jgi:DNA-binding NarL/FixJ family response regulator
MELRAEYLDAVRRTAGGDTVFTPGLARAGARQGPAADTPRLTDRETEVLRLVVSHRTVHNHVQNTLGKLQELGPGR